MNAVKTNGVGGEWVKITITIGGKTYTRITSPDGHHQYASAGTKRSSVRAGGITALMIDKAIANEK